MPTHTGRWDKTPFRGPTEAMLDVPEHEIPWVLVAVDDDPQATSGTRCWLHATRSPGETGGEDPAHRSVGEL